MATPAPRARFGIELHRLHLGFLQSNGEYRHGMAPQGASVGSTRLLDWWGPSKKGASTVPELVEGCFAPF
jgi:hypothetical protein